MVLKSLILKNTRQLPSYNHFPPLKFSLIFLRKKKEKQTNKQKTPPTTTTKKQQKSIPVTANCLLTLYLEITLKLQKLEQPSYIDDIVTMNQKLSEHK